MFFFTTPRPLPHRQSSHHRRNRNETLHQPSCFPPPVYIIINVQRGSPTSSAPTSINFTCTHNMTQPVVIYNTVILWVLINFFPLARKELLSYYAVISIVCTIYYLNNNI